MLRRLAYHYLPRLRGSRVVARIDRLCVAFHQAYANHNYDLGENGEKHVLEVLARRGGVGAVFDVGANVGDWSRLAAATLPEARIEAFEIVPATFRRLRERCASEPRIHAHDVGLGEAEGCVPVYCSDAVSEVASCVPGATRTILGLDTAPVEARVTTGERFCRAQGIARIGFLKIDVEGYEPQVLRGFGRMLADGCIDVVQFEYGYVNAHTGFLLRDFHRLFADARMRVGKVYPSGVEFRDYDPRHEDFLGPNYLAVRADRDDLLRALAA